MPNRFFLEGAKSFAGCRGEVQSGLSKIIKINVYFSVVRYGHAVER